MPAAPIPALAGPVHAQVTVYNETAGRIAVRQGAQRIAIATGDHATIAFAARAGAALVVEVDGRPRTYRLDLGLLGYDTIHVRPRDDAADAA